MQFAVCSLPIGGQFSFSYIKRGHDGFKLESNAANKYNNNYVGAINKGRVSHTASHRRSSRPGKPQGRNPRLLLETGEP